MLEPRDKLHALNRLHQAEEGWHPKMGTVGFLVTMEVAYWLSLTASLWLHHHIDLILSRVKLQLIPKDP